MKRRDKWNESAVQSLRSGLQHAKAPVGVLCYCLSVKESQFFSSDMVFILVIHSRDMTGCRYGMFWIEISTFWSYISALMIMLSSKCTHRHNMLTSILGPATECPSRPCHFNRQMETLPCMEKTQAARQLHVSLHICGIQEIAKHWFMCSAFLNTSPGIIRGNISCACPHSQLCGVSLAQWQGRSL